MTTSLITRWWHDWPRIAVVLLLIVSAPVSFWLVFHKARGGAGYSVEHVRPTVTSLIGIYLPSVAQLLAYALAEARHDFSRTGRLPTWLAIFMLTLAALVFLAPIGLLLALKPGFFDIVELRGYLATLTPVGAAVAVGAIAIVFHRPE